MKPLKQKKERLELKEEKVLEFLLFDTSYHPFLRDILH